MVRRSQRQEGQNPVNCSSGWRSQLNEDRGGCSGGGGGGAVGSAEVVFITVGISISAAPPAHVNNYNTIVAFHNVCGINVFWCVREKMIIWIRFASAQRGECECGCVLLKRGKGN